MAAHRRDAADDRETTDERAARDDLVDAADAGAIATATRVPTPFAPADGETDDRDEATGGETAGDETAGDDPIYPRTRAP